MTEVVGCFCLGGVFLFNQREEIDMDSFADERDFELLEQDRYTFFVLRRILSTPCELILTDHKRLVICLSSVPYPVWIWTSDDATEEEMQRAYELSMEHGFLDGTHTFNMKYGLAEYFISKSGSKLSVITNMFAYDNPNPIPPSTADKADGGPYQCTAQDADEFVHIMEMFYKETGIPELSMEEYRRKIDEGLKNGTYYCWKNSEGKNVACCTYHPVGKLASLGLVFTYPEYRRRHYAENLVYHVTKIAEQKGFLPMLYTDADYAASNACYEKIGYILRGKLCTIGQR